MKLLRPATLAAILAGILGFASLPTRVLQEPASVASLELGTDDAFAVEGMEPRENLVGGGALRWTRPLAAFEFEGLGPGAVDLSLRVRDHRTDLTLVANGAVVGTLPVGGTAFTSRVVLPGRDLRFEIQTEGFTAGSGRTLGTQFQSLTVSPSEKARRLPARLGTAAAIVCFVSVLGVWLAGVPAPLALASPLLLVLTTLPSGLWRSAWLVECAVFLSVASGIAAWITRPAPARAFLRSGLFLASLGAITTHAVLPPSPLVIQSDAQLHGNKVGEAAKGELFPTSRTDHRPPFDFPYGISFHGLVAPFSGSSSENAGLARRAAALASGASIAGLAFAWVRAAPMAAPAAVLLWAFAPVNLRVMGFGNLNNIFAQAIFALFLSTLVLSQRGRFRSAFLVLLVALSATAHLSSFIFMSALLVGVSLFRRARAHEGFRPFLAGVVVAACYFAAFIPLVLRQLPRVLGERGGSRGVFDPWSLVDAIAVNGAGAAALGLVVLSLVAGRVGPMLAWPREQILTALGLAVLGLVSPLEVRYMLALMPIIASLGGAAFNSPRVRDDGFPAHDLSSIVPLRLVRLLVSPTWTPLIASSLLAVHVWGGLRVLREFVPLWRG